MYDVFNNMVTAGSCVIAKCIHAYCIISYINKGNKDVHAFQS